MTASSPHVFDWIVPEQVAGCVNPSVGAQAAAEVRTARIGLLINLHERANPAELLSELGVKELHLPVPSTYAPTMEQLEVGLTAIRDAVCQGQRVAVHCGAGLGRTGTLLAVYLVAAGWTADDAMAHVRAVRPGSIETLEQEQAVYAFARRSAMRDHAADGHG